MQGVVLYACTAADIVIGLLKEQPPFVMYYNMCSAEADRQLAFVEGAVLTICDVIVRLRQMSMSLNDAFVRA